MEHETEEVRSPQPKNPHFEEFALHVREAAAALERAADTAIILRMPQFDFARVRRNLESIAQDVAKDLLWLAFVRHNALTDAPFHRRNSARYRGGQASSEIKRIAARENGRIGGRSRSYLKIEAARANGRLGGRPSKSGQGGARKVTSV